MFRMVPADAPCRPPAASPPIPPPRWPRAYRQLAERADADRAALLAMGEPHPGEALPDPDDLADPTGDRRLRPLPHLVRKHRDRVVVLAASRCFFRCRFCFRRGDPTPAPGPGEWAAAAAWCRNHPEVGEVILSGGDPLTHPDRRLARLGHALAGVPTLGRWRIHTRAPVVLPRRVTPALVAALAAVPLPLRLVVHANHPGEVTPEVARALAALGEAGVAVGAQSVLLAGVNDDPDRLAALFGALTRAGARPHYLHHPDRAPGNGPFRVSLARGLALYRAAQERSEVPLPPYVIDLPNGAGKYPVEALLPVARSPVGDRTRYRWVRPPAWDALVPDPAFEWWDVAEASV